MKRHLPVLVGSGVLLAWFFAPAVVGSSGFAFRDAAHYYHPLFEYLRGEWLWGRPPLWNPYENIGVPLVAQNTTSLFYPGKLLFALPLGYARLYHLYVVLHVALAAATSFALARHLRASPLAAALAAVSYAFSGHVLFQYCNVVFLVGAAWLPLAVLLAFRMFRSRQLGSALGFGAVLAMMITGGDPQMAYNAAILAALVSLLSWRDEKRSDRPPSEDRTMRLQNHRRATLLGVSLVVAGLLAAVQILPTLEAAPHSKRAKYESPRNIYELAWSFAAQCPHNKQIGRYDGLLARGSAGHQRQVYQFSVAPWRVVELAWPNVTGRAFPTNRRWLYPLGVESDAWDLWAPSLYLGLLPFVLGAVTWSVRRPAALEIRFLSWMVVFGALASLGVYGVAWMLGSPFGVPRPGGVGEEVGGLYWWLTVCLPGYVYFRYPAKLFVLACLGMSMLAARGWDGAWQTDRCRVQRWFVVLLVLSLLGLVVTALGWSYLEQLGSGAPPVAILGPFDWAGAKHDAASALAQTAALSLVFLATLGISDRRPNWRGWTCRAAFATTLLDLAIAQKYLLLYAPAEAWRSRPEVLNKLPEDASSYRVFRQLGPRPASWERSFSADRFAQSVRWDRRTLWPKYPLPYATSLVEASETIISDDYRVLLDVARRADPQGRASPLPDPSVLNLLAARVAIVAGDVCGALESAERIAEGMFVGTRPAALDRAWIVHNVEVLPKLEGNSPTRLRELTERVLFPEGKPRDWRRDAVVESDEPIGLTPQTRDASADERCTIAYADPMRVEIDAYLETEGLVVLSDLYYPGWQLTVETLGRSRRLPILRTNRVMRGAVLPAGRHRLVYRYRPASVLYGGVISGLSVLLLGGAAVYVGIRRRDGLGSRTTRRVVAD